MAKCEACLHRSVCEIRTCSECSGGFGCDDCEIYHSYDGTPSIENCEHFKADDTKTKHGKWSKTLDEVEIYDYVYECSVCGGKEIGNDDAFCPWCGTKMKKEGVNNE